MKNAARKQTPCYRSVIICGIVFLGGCASPSTPGKSELAAAIRDFQMRETAGIAANDESVAKVADSADPRDACFFGMIPQGSPDSRPASAAASDQLTRKTPEYWRPNLARQAGGELKQFITRDGWLAFKDAYWRADNALILAGTLGASVAIRESGVDDAVRRRTVGEFKMGDLDESVQILGNPATHFAAAGLLWAGSAATQDLKTHEFSRALGEALIVNGVTTMALKVGTNTRGPDGDNRAWPSGHTSSAFTTAAVIHEFYGPWAGIPSLALAGLVGYQRIDSRVHDLSDVAFGAVLGYVVGASIAKEQKGDFPEIWGMKVLPYTDPQTGATGLALFKSW